MRGDFVVFRLFQCSGCAPSLGLRHGRGLVGQGVCFALDFGWRMICMRGFVSLSGYVGGG